MKKRALFLLLFGLLCGTWSGCAANRFIYSASPGYKELFYTKTEDGWSLAVVHYPPQGPVKDKPPVILCHGLNQNFLCWDLLPKYSFARYLAENGYDVWSVSLRGSGKSTKPGWVQVLDFNQLHPDLFKWRQYNYRKFNWNFDDYILKDVPTLIHFVQEKTGKKDVTWIGHSMGGLILCAYLGVKEEPGIKNAVLIGAPAIIPQPPCDVLKTIEKEKKLMRVGGVLINTKNIYVMTAPFTPKEGLDAFSCNLENMTKEVLARIHTQVIENTSPGVIMQVQLMVEKGDLVSMDGKIDYTANMYKLKSNLLCLAGKADNLAPPMAVLTLYHAAQSTDKTYRLFGIANGYSVDYGHNDMILGIYAQQEVFPYILAWLDQH